MTNQHLKQELDLIKTGMIDLKELCGNDGMQTVHIDTFVRLLLDRYEEVHSEVTSILRNQDLIEAAQRDGKDAALKLLDTWGKQTTAEVVHQ